jgi:hypothetical protein
LFQNKTNQKKRGDKKKAEERLFVLQNHFENDYREDDDEDHLDEDDEEDCYS